ncbi:hypothetical protein NQ318_018696 [Aromia moschata]|uniref:DUF4817 domain-containing protein n=1 Tax=Aromia moschata TaxID=1265417 RepID=A0AAV8ZFV0_9CUCU|nr:hypothetical protein NQ318_018696 [Aromia moschata]
MSLSDTKRIEILILLGCGDKTRTQKQVCEIFHTTYPDRRISQSTINRVENKFLEFGNVTDIPKSGRKRILDDEQKLDILLDIQDNPHKPTRQVATDNDVIIACASAGFVAPGLLAAHSLVVPAGHGLEGQYVPSGLEKLYDDGSYKPELSPLPLSPSPYGLTPSGSGLEGQYVPSGLERLSDDGSYKPEISPLPLAPSPYGYVPAGSGIEGSYVHDVTEHLYDDGSYKPGYYH